MTDTNQTELTFEESKHEYKSNGVIIPSVTQILKEAGLIDLSFVSKELLAWKSDVGTKVHKTTELFDLKNLDENSLHPLLKGYLSGWKKFREDYLFVPTLIEQRIIHNLYRYAGTIDRIGLLGKKQEITQLDIKSGVYHHSHAIQSAGYTELYNYDKEKKLKITRRMTIYLHEDGKFDVREYKDPNDIKVFLSALTITNYLRKH